MCKKRLIIKLLITCITVCFIQPSNSYSQFRTYESKNLRLIYYDHKHSYVIPHLRRCFENSFKFHSKLFDYTPTEKITVLFQDFDDYGYAGATALPFNYMVLGIEPFEYVYETSPTNERLNWVMSHELTHVVTTDKSSPLDNFYRSLFLGKVSATSENPVSMIYSYLTTPRKYSPRWYLESIAVFMETWMAGGIGRAQSGYDEMVFRTMVRDSSYFYDFVGLESEGTTIDFQIGQNSYLYGARFVSYLAHQYGPEKVLAWFDRTSESNPDYTSQFEKIYSVSLDYEWSRWIEWEHTWQQMNLDTIRKFPLTKGRYISAEPLGAISRTYYDSTLNQLYAAVSYPGELARIVSIEIGAGKVNTICNLATPALYYVCHLAFDAANRVLFYTTKNNKGWRDLCMVDLKSGSSEVLVKNSRAGDLVFNATDKSVWGIQHHNGYSTIVRFPPPFSGWNELVRLPYGTDLFDIDISPDGKYLTGSVMEISGKQKLVKMFIEKLLLGDNEYETLYQFENNSPLNFVFSPDGKYLYGSTYYTGVSNVVRYEFETKKMEWLTNCETGLFRPVPVSADSLIAFQYSGKGFIPVEISNVPTENVSNIKYLGYEISEKHPIVRSWILPSPLTIEIDTLTDYAGVYDGFSNIRINSAYPIVDGFKDFTAYGIRFNFLDPLLMHDINLSATYTPHKILPSNERFHASFNYSYWGWKFSASYNRSDFYDLFGPTKMSRKGYSVGLTYNDRLLDDNPQILEYTLGAAGWGGLERLPDYQNVSASYDRYLTGNIKLNYRNLRRSLGAIEAECGVRGQFNTLDNYVNGKHFPRLSASGDYGFMLPIYHSSIWLRSSLGYSFGKRSEPFANFYFGGFGNNWVDYQEAKRYRSYYSFPGTEINAIGGTNFGKLLFEWTLPPLRFRRFGLSNFYCNWAHLTIFSSGIVTNIDSKEDRASFINSGSQIDFKIVLFSRLESTLSVGYAIAAEKRQRLTKEFMVSLKIL
ncbi:MAG: hypothetical protein C0417_13735 [Chlorobiaceae bacterium]|nr:hypothetical protein [Chlorobiaceae bacterium]